MEGGANSTSTSTNTQGGRLVMVVADPTRESAGALQYALSHAILDNDELILIHVVNPCAKKSSFSPLSSIFRKPVDPNAPPCHVDLERGICDAMARENWEFLEVMKRACELAYPKMKVRVDKVEQGSMEKATAILFRSKLLSIDLLIVGQRRNLSSVFLGNNKPRKNGGALSRTADTVEYLIENCVCTCVGVQKKGQKAGYLLSTKTHRNFWLLA